MCSSKSDRAFLAHEAAGQSARPAVRADDRTDDLDTDIFDRWDTLAQHIRQLFRVLGHVSLQNQNCLILGMFDIFRRMLHDGAKGFFSALHFFHRVQLAALSHADDGFDIQHGAARYFRSPTVSQA